MDKSERAELRRHLQLLVDQMPPKAHWRTAVTLILKDVRSMISLLSERDALEAEVARLREALTDAIDDLKTTLRFDCGWECSEEDLRGPYLAALSTPPEHGEKG